MQNFDRYGTVVFDEDYQINLFKEKVETVSGWINGGIYIMDTSAISSFPSEEKFSFEAYLNEKAGSGNLTAFLSDGFFIDIGIPEDYEKSQALLPLIADHTFKGWTLFLDRDGVINVRTPGDYVKSMSEWEYCKDALSSIRLLSFIFDRIIVVTNQQGVALGKMTSYMLDVIHQNLKDDVRKHGGHIDAVYSSIDLKEKPNNSRKPNGTMGHWAKKDFPDIDFAKSIVVGDSATDIEFGQTLGMKTVCVEGKFEDTEAISRLSPDWIMSDLATFANTITQPNNIFQQVVQDQEILKN